LMQKKSRPKPGGVSSYLFVTAVRERLLSR